MFSLFVNVGCCWGGAGKALGNALTLEDIWFGNVFGWVDVPKGSKLGWSEKFAPVPDPAKGSAPNGSLTKGSSPNNSFELTFPFVFPFDEFVVATVVVGLVLSLKSSKSKGSDTELLFLGGAIEYVDPFVRSSVSFLSSLPVACCIDFLFIWPFSFDSITFPFSLFDILREDDLLPPVPVLEELLPLIAALSRCHRFSSYFLRIHSRIRALSPFFGGGKSAGSQFAK